MEAKEAMEAKAKPSRTVALRKTMEAIGTIEAMHSIGTIETIEAIGTIEAIPPEIKYLYSLKKTIFGAEDGVFQR